MNVDFEPQSEGEAADIVHAAAQRSARLKIIGGGTRGISDDVAAQLFTPVGFSPSFLSA